MATPTELFINSELPKRPYTNQFPLEAGHVPVATGNGLEVEARALTTSDISGMSNYATQEDLSNVLAGLWDDRGAYTVNAAGNINYPSSAGSGVAGALMKGDIFTVAGAVAGVSTINNIAVNNGDTVRALVDDASATNDAHWAIAENNPDTPTVKSYIDNYDISAASINSTGTVTLTRTASDLTFQVPTAISGLSFDPNTGILTSSYTNNAISTTITVAANEVSDNVFRIKDNTDATKKIAFEASSIATGQTKTITMPDVDVDLGNVAQAATSTLSGYLSSTDWSTFNGKQAALADVVTADTYGSSTQWPIVTVNAKGIVTGVTLQTASVAEVSDSVFRVVDNSDATKKLAFEASGIGTGQTRTITMPNIDVDLGKAVYRKDIFNLPVPLSSLRAGDEIDLTVSLATVSMQHSDTFSTVKGYYFNNNTQGTVTFTLSRSLGTASPTTLTNIDGVTGETLSSQDFTVTPTAFDYTVYIPRYGRLLISPGSSGQVRLVVYSPQSNSISTNNSLWCESTTLAGSHNTAIKCKDLKIHANQKFGRFEDLWGFPLTSQLPGATSPANGILVPIGTKMRGFKGHSVVGSTSGCRVEAVFTRTVVGATGSVVTMRDSDGITPYSHMASWSGGDPITEHYITLRRGSAYLLILVTVGPSLGSGAIVGSTTLHSVGTLPAVSVSISGGRLIASFTPPGQAYYSYEIRSVYGVDL